MPQILVRSLVLCGALGVGCATGEKLEATGTNETTSSESGSGAQGGGGENLGGHTASGGGGGAGGATQTTGSAGAGGDGGQGGTTQGGGGTGGQTTSSTESGSGGTGGTVLGHECGDAMVDVVDEECDGPNLNDQTCESLGFVSGTLGCSSKCKFDTSLCSKCGNGSVEPMLGEECDFDAVGNPLVLTTCAGLGFAGSTKNPGCDVSCHYDTAPCLCGNAVADGNEDCDGADFGGKTCQTFGFNGGNLTCNNQCEILANGCFLTNCGNGVIDAGEACDGNNLGGKTCATQGFPGGSLMCGAGCQLVTTGCFQCGNGIVEGAEQCDDSNTVSGDGCSAVCQTENMTCDPDGTYLVIQGGPINYACCSGLVSVNVSSFIFSGNGATVLASPSNPVPLAGTATTCPMGSFSNTGSIPGGCTETYTLTGSYTNQDTWSGLFQVSFSGADCSCFGGLLGAPCIAQAYSVTAQR